MRVLAAILLLLASASAQAPPFEVVDTMPAYWEFWEQARDKPVAEQARLFEKLVVARYPELYTPAVLGLDEGKPFSAALAARYADYYERTHPHFDTMRRLSSDLRGELDRYVGTFMRAFPDFDYRGRVYFMNSLGAFDGATRTVAGSSALLFGLDTIARINGPGADVAPFFHHELFHVYHGQAFAERGNGELYRALWGEGLAVYVSRVLNPGAPEEQIFGRPVDTPARARAVLPQLARDFRARMDSTSRSDYARYFFGRRPPEADSPDVPPRAGYYLGYLVAERLAKKRDLRALAATPPSALRAEIEQVLRDLEAGK